MKELEYLRSLCSEYGSYYIRKYFDFSLGDIAKYCGMTRQTMGHILSGKRQMPKKYEARFIEAFQHFQIIEKTKDFKLSESQKGIRDNWYRVKNMLTGLVIFAIVMIMTNARLFFKGSKVSGLYYIRRELGLSQYLIKPILMALVVLSTNAFFIFKRELTKAQAKIFSGLGFVF